MPSIDDIFPDKWLKASHLIAADGRRPIVAVTIRGAGIEKLHNPKTNNKEDRLVVEFEGKDKRLILNKTQAQAIAAIAGTKDYTKWRGARLMVQAGIAPNKMDTILILAPTPTPTQGDPNPGVNPEGKTPTPTPTPHQEDQDLDAGDHNPGAEDDNPFE